VSNQTYTAGDAVGYVEIVVTDSAGGSANSVVSIAPSTPGNFTVTANTAAKTITVTWTYATMPLISFQLWQSANGGAYTLAASPVSGSTTWTSGTLTTPLPAACFLSRLRARARNRESGRRGANGLAAAPARLRDRRVAVEALEQRPHRTISLLPPRGAFLERVVTQVVVK